MTDQQLEQRLRTWYRAQLTEAVTAPVDLRISVAGITDLPAHRIRPFRFARSFAYLAAAAVLGAILIGGALIVGSELQRSRFVLPPSQSPSPVLSPKPTNSAAIAQPEPTASPSGAPAPSAVLTPEPTPQWLIAVYEATGSTAHIFTLDPVTGGQIPLGVVAIDSVQLRSRVYSDIVWSSDRHFVTVSRVTDGALVQAQFDIEQSEMTPISVPFESYVSPDGQRLAGLNSDPNAVTITDLDGNELSQVELPPTESFQSAIAWTPDGLGVLVIGYLPTAQLPGHAPGRGIAATLTGPAELFLVPLDGGAVQIVATLANGGFSSPEMSPDVSTVIANTYCTTTCSLDPGIVSIDLANGTVTQLTHNAGDFGPRWSPDGSRIAFERMTGKGRGIWVMDSDGSNLARLTAPTSSDRDHSLAWSPDGNSLLFSRGDTSRPGLGDLWVVSSTGGEARQLITNAVGDW